MKFHRKIQFIFFVLLLFSTFIYFGCSDSGTNTNGGEGSLVVKITDSPFPISLVAEANVTIAKIEIRKANEDDDNPYITVSDEDHTYNLINLRNGITEDLPKLEIPADTYDLVRLYVAAATVVLNDGQEFDLTIPSGVQTGIKIFIDPPIVVEGGLTSELLLDFDLSKSFVVQGNPDTPAGITGFIFKPVIRAVNNSTAGRVVGSVTDTLSAALSEAQIWVEQDSVISFTFSNSDGLYALIGLPAGIYSAFATKEGYDTVSVQNVEVVAGNQTLQNFTLTPQ